MDAMQIDGMMREAGFPRWDPYQGTEVKGAAESNARVKAIAERFAVLVAEECAKIAEKTPRPYARDFEPIDAADAIRSAFKP